MKHFIGGMALFIVLAVVLESYLGVRLGALRFLTLQILAGTAAWGLL